jgi:putative NADPH-quinone reductase
VRKKKITIILGHLDKTMHCGDFARAYEKGAREAGHETKLIYLGDLKFDPILHKGYKEIQALEPDLMALQESIKWAEHLVIIYPNWFITMPALLKGMFDRLWLPGFAYHFNPNGFTWKKLLKGRSARVFVSMDSSPLAERIMLGDFTNEIRKGILGFAGFSPVRITKIGYMHNIKEVRHKRLQKRVELLGSRAR